MRIERYIAATGLACTWYARAAPAAALLRGLRNSAAHASALTPSTPAALEYVQLATTLTQSLVERAPDPGRERAVGRP